MFAVIVVKAAFGGLGRTFSIPRWRPRPAAVAVSRVHDPFRGPWGIRLLDLGSADVVSRHALHSMVMPALPDVPLRRCSGQHRWVYR
ncbi:MAG: hypothetical protein ACLTYN_07330 [Dysosmobacter welbionis]